MRFIVAASVLALALMLTACAEPFPTPSPTATSTPSPTPAPTATPEPTALERLAWFDSRPDAAHWIAWNALLRMAVDDEPLSNEIASLDWVVDGITPEEAGALDDVSWLVRDNPGIAATALSLSWMTTDGVITPENRRALRAIRAAAAIDENLGATLAGYGWLTDGLVEREADVLEVIAEMAAPAFTTHTATGIGASRLDLAGYASYPSASPDDVKVATILAHYSWLQDSDVTRPEAEFINKLIELGEIAGPRQTDALDIVLAYDWVEDGIAEDEPASLARYEKLFEAAGEANADVLPIILDYQWIADGLLLDEVRSVSRFSSLLAARSADDSDVIRTMVSYDWLSDSIDRSEYLLLSEIPSFVGKTETGQADYWQKILEYAWLSDAINLQEVSAFRMIVDCIEFLPAGFPSAVNSFVEYEWLQDDIRDNDLQTLRTLKSILERTTADTDDFTVAVVTSTWLQDAVDESEERLLDTFSRYLTYRHSPGTAVPPRLATYPWIDDGVSEIEIAYVRSALDLHHYFSPTFPELTYAIVQNSGMESASLQGVMAAFHGLYEVIRISDSVYDGGLTADITNIPWLFDGLERLEGWWLSEYSWLLRVLDGENEELAESVLARPWARDGITRDEIEWTHQFRRLLQETTGENRAYSLRVAESSWFQDQIGSLEAGVMGRLASAALNNLPLITDSAALDRSNASASEVELVLFIALQDAQVRSKHQYEDLLQQRNIVSRTVTLTLAGDVELYVVRHTEFPDDDPTLDLMEQIAIPLEEFMGVPYPHTRAVILIMEPSWRAGETPQYGVAYATPTHIVAVAPRHNPGFHLAVFHEMSHMYWGGHTGAPPWWTEGAAGFLPDYARDSLGQESLTVRRRNLIRDTQRECRHRGVDNVSEYYEIQETSPTYAADRGICIYALGELFLMDMYLRLGHDVTSAAMRQLYLDAEASGWTDKITDQKIYDAFVDNISADQWEEFHDLFDRLHGGAKVTLREPPAETAS